MITELLLLFLGLFLVWNLLARPKNFPPGPLGIPVLGHLPLMGVKSHKTLVEWKKAYGPIIGIWFGSYRTVVIQDAKLIREAMDLIAFSGRPAFSFASARSNGVARGIVFTEGHRWSEQRGFAQRNLRDLGFGAKTIEGKIQEEISEFLQVRLRSSVGKPIQGKNVFSPAVVNTLWNILFGERLDQEDPEVLEAIRRIASSFENTSIFATLAIFMPWINRISPTLSGYSRMMEESIPLNNFMRKQIEKHIANYIPGHPRDFVDVYADEVRKTADPESSFHADQGEMLFALLDLFIAGAKNTSTALSWMLVYLIYYPEVQKKLQAEIDEVVWKESLPCLADRPFMAYTEAVLSEVMRFSSITPFAFYNTTEDVEFKGFFIPKDTVVIPSMYSAHFDEEVWGDPQNFRPERFLNGDGRYKRNENLLPFSTGIRACLGENLARDELFLFCTSFFQAFTASASDKLPSLEPQLGFTLSPQPFEVILKCR